MKKLRIFYGFDLNLAQNMGFIQTKDIWTENIYATLIKMGYDVVPFDYNLGETFKYLEKIIPEHIEFAKNNRPKIVQEFLKQIRAAHAEKKIDLLFSYFYDHFMTTEAIEEVKKMGILTVNYNCNASYQLDLISDISKAFDYCFTVEDFRMDDYKKLGANPIYFQEAANPEVYKPINLAKKYDVVFIGAAYGDRMDYVNQLIQNGINIKVFGYGWDAHIQNTSIRSKIKYYRKLLKHYIFGAKKPVKSSSIIEKRNIGGTITLDEMVRVYSEAKIAVSFATCGSTHLEGKRIVQIRLRDFEAPMCGCFYITEYQEELGEFYRIGNEIVCYKDRNELVDKIKYYLAHAEEREKIRKAGYERAIKDHTWERRFEKAFKEIGVW